MGFAIVAAWSLFGLSMLLVALKIVEMWVCSIYPNLRLGRQRADRFHETLRSQGLQAAVDEFQVSGYEPWQLSAHIAARAPERFRRALPTVFGWPTLTAIVSIELALLPDGAARTLTAGTLVVLLLTRVVHRGVARLFLGIADNVYMDPFTRRSQPFNLSRLAGSAGLRTILDVGMICFAFSSIYFALESSRPASLGGDDKPATWIECVYFSFATVSTSAYAELVPTTVEFKFLVLIEMMLGWTVLVIMGLHYAMSVVELEVEGSQNTAAGRGAPTADGAATSAVESTPRETQPNAGPISIDAAADPFSPVFGATKLLLAILLTSLVLHSLWSSVFQGGNGFAGLYQPDLKHHLEEILGLTFLLIVILEFAETLISHRPEHVVNMLIFLVARKMIVKSDEAYEIFIGVISVGLLFLVRSYLRRTPSRSFWQELVTAIRTSKQPKQSA